jgi:hypothetical protein
MLKCGNGKVVVVCMLGWVKMVDGDYSDYPCWCNLGDVELMLCSKIK